MIKAICSCSSLVTCLSFGVAMFLTWSPLENKKEKNPKTLWQVQGNSWHLQVHPWQQGRARAFQASGFSTQHIVLEVFKGFVCIWGKVTQLCSFPWCKKFLCVSPHPKPAWHGTESKHRGQRSADCMKAAGLAC